MERQLEKAWLLYRQSQYQMAIDVVHSVLLSEPNKGDAHALWALCLLGQKNIHGAEAKAREAVAYSPNSEYALFVYASVMAGTASHFGAIERTKRLKEGHQVIDQALSLNPSDADFHFLKARFQLLNNNVLGANASIANGLQADPEHVDCMNMSTNILLHEGKADQALHWAERALAIEPENAECHAQLGSALAANQDEEKALVHLREALRIDPNHCMARETLVDVLKSRSRVFRLLQKPNEWWARMPEAKRARVRWSVSCIVLVGSSLSLFMGRWYAFAILVGLFMATIVCWSCAYLLTDAVVFWSLRQDKQASKFIDAGERTAWDFCLVTVVWLAAAGATWLASNTNLALAACVNIGTIAAPLTAERLLRDVRFGSSKKPTRILIIAIVVLCLLAAALSFFSPATATAILMGTSLLSLTFVMFQFATAN